MDCYNTCCVNLKKHNVSTQGKRHRLHGKLELDKKPKKKVRKRSSMYVGENFKKIKENKETVKKWLD